MEILTFGSWSLEQALADLAPTDLDHLAFGVVKLDCEGYILAYNQTEGEITGRKPEAMLGKHFFDEVAPCTQSSEFCGRFQEAVEEGSINVYFEYIFDHQMRPTKVQVRLYKNQQEAAVWLFIKRL